MATIETIRDPKAIRQRSRQLRAAGKRIAVVPTMGALHEGHLSLIRLARERADEVIVTIFVNPTQFGPGEDLDKYPRQEAQDLELASEAGATLAFCPMKAAMYPAGFETMVQPGGLAEAMCGAGRPGHFAGVCTIVCKLFQVTEPDLAVFGQKDYQQLAIIRRMTRDLDFDIEILGGAIVREADGLAMSSRNAYLSPQEREQARALSRGLAAAKAAYGAGERHTAKLMATVREVIEKDAPLGAVEYIELRDADTLESATDVSGPAVLALAVKFGGARLIDNCVL